MTFNDTVVSYFNYYMHLECDTFLTPPPPCAAYIRLWTGLSLVQIMTCRLFGAKSLPEQMLAYCQLDSWEHTSLKFEFEFYLFHSGKCYWKWGLPKRSFCLDLNVLSGTGSTDWSSRQLTCGLVSLIPTVYTECKLQINGKIKDSECVSIHFVSDNCCAFNIKITN